MKKTFENWAYHDYTTKLSVSIVYALIASVALNFFYQPGHIYSSGITGLAQILTTLSKSLIGFEVPVSTTLYLLNIPLFVLAWFKIGKKFTIFTFITVTLTSLCIHILP
ncbi:YitT family protein, partial [Escherichia coli]|nr:YitT family protein [Escherichia coli]